MVKIFIDTEFTRLPIPADWTPDPTNHISMISIGLVDEKGTKAFYAEQTDGWNKKDCSDFTIETVLPLLEGGSAQRTREQLSNDLFNWVASFNDKTIFCCDFLVDWFFVRNLLKDRCTQMDYELINYWAPDEQMAHEWMLDNFFDPINRPRHHALNDAMGLREIWTYIHGATSVKT